MIKNLKMGSLSWNIRVRPQCNHIYSPEKEAEGDSAHTAETEVGRLSREKSEGATVMRPQAIRSCWRQDTGSPLEPPEEAGPCPCFDFIPAKLFGHLDSRTLRARGSQGVLL